MKIHAENFVWSRRTHCWVDAREEVFEGEDVRSDYFGKGKSVEFRPTEDGQAIVFLDGNLSARERKGHARGEELSSPILLNEGETIEVYNSHKSADFSLVPVSVEGNST